MGFGSIMGGAIGAIGSTILGNHSAKKESEKNRDFQEYMSNTSISRRMQDLKNAGLNPLLAVDNASAGASTPSGSQAQIQSFDPSWITALSSAKLQKEQSETQKAQTEQVKEQTKAIQQENSLFDIKKKQLEQEAELQRQGILTEKTVQELNNANSLEAKARILVNQANEKNIKMSTEEAKRKVQLLDLEINKELEARESIPDLPRLEKISTLTTNPFNSISTGLYYLDKLVRDSAKNINLKFSKDNKKRGIRR